MRLLTRRATNLMAVFPARGDELIGSLQEARMALTMLEKEVRGVTILHLAGNVTLGEESNQLRAKLRELLAQGKTRLVLDLAEVNYIDSAGLGTLVAGYTSAQNQGAEMKLANLTKRINEQLHITKLVTVFDVYDSVETAVNSFATS
jgi:anti-sigma B factor antagonist